MTIPDVTARSQAARTSPPQRHTPSRTALLALALLLAVAAATPERLRAQEGVVEVFPGRAVEFPANKEKVGLKQTIDIPARDEYYLDYTARFHDNFDFTCGGKLPGLAGGKGTTGKRDIEEDGWSVRYMWKKGGRGEIYYYHQNRKNKGGDRVIFSEDLPHFRGDRTYRLTMRVVINDPDKRNGVMQAWLDGQLVVDVHDVELRGDVARDVARVDLFKLSSFHGGCGRERPPNRKTRITFGDFHVMTCRPDFGGAAGTCAGDAGGGEPGSGEAVALQAEGAEVGGGTIIQSSNGGFNGSGYVNFPSSGGYVEFRGVDGGSGGPARLALRYAHGDEADRTAELRVNGASRDLTFTPTGAWDRWSTLEVEVALEAGSGNTIHIASAGQDGGNLDEIAVTPSDGGGGSPAPIGERIWLQAVVNGKYVAALAEDDPLAAEGSKLGDEDQYEVVDAGGSTVALRSVRTGKFIAATSAESPLYAEGNEINPEDQYEWIANGDGTVSLRSVRTGGYVRSSDGGSGPLLANGQQLGQEDKYAWSVVGAASKAAAPTAAPASSLAGVPVEYALMGAYPNPFNPTTAIRFALPEGADVRLEVFDVTGRRVALLVDGAVSAGHHEASFEASSLPSGLYLYRLEATGASGAFAETGKMTLLK